jgi:hypothetical protein
MLKAKLLPFLIEFNFSPHFLLYLRNLRSDHLPASTSSMSFMVGYYWFLVLTPTRFAILARALTQLFFLLDSSSEE